MEDASQGFGCDIVGVSAGFQGFAAGALLGAGPFRDCKTLLFSRAVASGACHQTPGGGLDMSNIAVSLLVRDQFLVDQHSCFFLDAAGRPLGQRPGGRPEPSGGLG